MSNLCTIQLRGIASLLLAVRLMAMKLAVLVAYHFSPDYRPLVALHLDRLRQHSDVDYKVYGGAIRLAPADHDWLASQPDVVLPPLPKLPPEGRGEHNVSLDALARAAYDDGATHFVSLHLDSFPIDDNWLSPAIEAVASGKAFSCIEPRCYNAFLLWDRSWQDIGAEMLLSDADRASDRFAEFKTEHPKLNHADGGLGFLFTAWQMGKSWHSVQQTSPAIWGDRLLHVEGATRSAMKQQVPSTLKRLQKPIGMVLPKRLRKVLGPLLRNALPRPKVVLKGRTTIASKAEQVKAVVADPDGFIARCRAAPLPPDAHLAANQGVVDASLGR